MTTWQPITCDTQQPAKQRVKDNLAVFAVAGAERFPSLLSLSRVVPLHCALCLCGCFRALWRASARKVNLYLYEDFTNSARQHTYHQPSCHTLACAALRKHPPYPISYPSSTRCSFRVPDGAVAVHVPGTSLCLFFLSS